MSSMARGFNKMLLDFDQAFYHRGLLSAGNQGGKTRF
jgi:hypothetical protein